MVLMQFQIHSQVLDMETDVWALVPGYEGVPGSAARPQKPWRTLWLLHGGVGDHTFWVRHTQIEKIAGQYEDVAVIMPDAYGSSCTDTYSGARFGTYLARELPRSCAAYFPTCRSAGKTTGYPVFPTEAMEVCIWVLLYRSLTGRWEHSGQGIRRTRILAAILWKKNGCLDREICITGHTAYVILPHSWPCPTVPSRGSAMAAERWIHGGI